ncbi:MAG: rRNA pseudouridine synthase [Ahniella sp.]|nr:rRNA pseudouridine synthase [Ahniella sp.]
MTIDKSRLTLKLKRDKPAGTIIEERIQKVLAQAGLGSRRTIEERVAAGDIRINGQPATVGNSVRTGDRVEIDGKAFMATVTPVEDIHVLLYHKPEGEISTTEDPEGRRTVYERMPRLKNTRWISIGRLDMNTTGLLLMTTDGELANAMMHPSRELEREYVCRIHGTVTEAMMKALQTGVQLEDGPAKFDELHVISLGESHSWFRVIIKEGRNREVRRMWEAVGVEVSRLKRIRYGKVELPRELRRGHFRAMPIEEVRALREELGLQPIPESLTLQAVIGVRRASRTLNEYRPEGKSESYSSGNADEARELRAFDRVDDLRRPPKRPRKPGAGAGAGFKKGGGKRGPGQPVDPNSFRGFGSGDDGNRMPGNRKPGGKGPRGPGGPGARGPGGPGARGPGGPGARGPGGAGARGAGGPGARGPGGPRKPREFVGPMDSNQFALADRGPPRGGNGNRAPSGIDGNRAPSSRPPSGNRGPGGPGGNRGPGGGNRGPRGPRGPM